jgi:serine/threonine protein kinase
VTTYSGQSHSFEEITLLSDAGGFANVYLAAEVGNPDHKVAIKVPKTGLPPHVADAFLREAEAATRVASPYVVELVDWGDNPPFIAYEYMASGTLGREIDRRQQANEPWSVAELIDLFSQLVTGMDAINAQVVHRDLKPDNIYLDAGVPRISDFGISKYVGDMTRTLTFKGAGTALYMAPETFRLDSTDWKADQYSLGVVFFELATLTRPFSGDWDALEQAHLYQPAPLITGVREDFPLRLARLVTRMLEKEADRRFGSWGEIIDTLSSIREQNEDAVGPPDVPTNALAERAAAALHQAKTEQLAAQEAADRQRAWETERNRLVTYWGRQFGAKVRARVEALNGVLGEQAYELTTEEDFLPPRPNHCSVRFFEGNLIVQIEAPPYQNERNAWAWGKVTLTTNQRGWFSNLVLLPEPAPYGTWQQIDMELSGLVQQGTQPENRKGGKYKLIGRAVLADDWNFLEGEWDYRTTMSVVNYKETTLDFDKLLDELFEILTNDGPKPKPPPPAPPQGGPFGDYRWPNV